MEGNHRIDHSIEVLVRNKAELLLQKVDLTASISALDYEIAQLHENLNALKAKESIETAAYTDATVRILRLLDEQEGCLTETISSLQFSCEASFPNNERLWEGVEVSWEVHKGKRELETWHRERHRRMCEKCEGSADRENCPICRN